MKIACNKSERTVNMLKQKSGITLIALVVTIVVLLILAGITISLVFGENGVITSANKAKIMMIIGTLKEKINLESLEEQFDGGKITPEILLAEGKISRTVQQADDGNYYMYYIIKESAYPEMSGLGKGNFADLTDVFLIDDKLNIKYIANNGKEYGDNIENKILEDETDIRFSSKAFSEYISKKSGVEEEEMKFKWMKNQKKLEITDSAIDSLQDLVFFPNLETLYVGNWGGAYPNVSKLTGIENCTKLKELWVIGGPDKDYTELAYLPNLKIFQRARGNDYDNVIDALKLCQNLEQVVLRGLKMTDMSRISELGNIKILSLQDNDISKIEGLENMTNLEELNLSDNEITSIEGLENLTKLEILNLQNNQITDILPVSVNSSLMELYLKGNSGIDGNKDNYIGEKLEKLNTIGEILDRGGEISIDIDKLGLFTNYRKLDLSGQGLTTLEPLEGMTELTTLTLSGNKLTLKDEKSQEILKSMSNLESLNLYNNQIEDISVINNLMNLKSLNLSGNENVNLKEIEDIISNLDSLAVSQEVIETIVNCDPNKITKLCFYNYYSNVTELPDLTKFTKLTYLSFRGHGKINNLDIISNIGSLQTLILENMEMHGRMIDLSNLTNLTSLNLSSNDLWTEDLKNLEALKNNKNLSINLRYNSIIDASSLLVFDSNCRIYLEGNINLNEESKNALKEKFGSRVYF